MAKILGIDLGTTNSAMAIIEAGNQLLLKTLKVTGLRHLLWLFQKPMNAWLDKLLSVRQ